MSESSETVYDRIARLESEVALQRAEIDRLKGALRSKIARHEIALIKSGKDITSIIAD